MQKNKKQAHKQSVKKSVPVEVRWYRDRTTLLYMGVLAIAVFVTFFPVLSHEFVNWDDDVNVYDNPNIDKLTAENVKKIFTSPVIGNYNPLPILTFAIEKHFFGLNPFIYHFDNLLLHILNTLLVFFLAVRLGLKRPAAFVLAALFGIHPMRVESVAWVTERKDVLFGLFTLSAMLCYISWLKGKKKIFLWWTYLFFLVSVFAKIQAVALPLSLLAIDYYMNRPLKWRLVIEKVPMFLVSLAVGLAGIWLLSEQKSLDPLQYSLVEKLLIGSWSLVIFIVKSVVPYEMSAVYPFPKPGDIPWGFYLSPLVIIILATGIFYSRKQTKVPAFGFLFFLFNIMFLLQVVAAGQGFIADRFGYIAYFGLFFIYAYGLQWLLENRPAWKTALWAATAAVLLVLGGFARNRVYVWKNPDTLWTDVLSKYKNVAVAYNNRGKYYRENKQFDKALADYDNMLRIAPDDFNGFNSRGRLWFDLGKIDKALPDFNRSIELNPRFAKAYSNRGAVYGMRKEYALAAADLTRSLELNPGEFVAYSNRALVYMALDRYGEAAADCKAYLRIKPEDASMWDLAAACYMNQKKYDTALICSENAIGLDPSVGSFYFNRCYIHFFLGEKEKARSDAEKAQRMGMKMDPAFVKQLKP
jgi:tetratricopeptide (TPR) repeat protein